MDGGGGGGPDKLIEAIQQYIIYIHVYIKNKPYISFGVPFDEPDETPGHPYQQRNIHHPST